MDQPDNIYDVYKPSYIQKRITVATVIKVIRSPNLNVCSANKRIFVNIYNRDRLMSYIFRFYL